MQLLTKLLPAPLTDSVELGCCKITGNYSKDILTSREKDILGSFGSVSRRREYLSSRWLIKEMTGRMNMSPGHFQVEKDGGGRPFGLYKGNQYNISIAHSKGDTVCAISPKIKVGVDLEPKNRSISERLRERLLSDREQSLLADEDTLRLWTVKEAVLKLRGSGLRTNLTDWVIISKHKNIFTAEYIQKEQVKVYSFSYQGNWISVACNT